MNQSILRIAYYKCLVGRGSVSVSNTSNRDISIGTGKYSLYSNSMDSKGIRRIYSASFGNNINHQHQFSLSNNRYFSFSDGKQFSR